MKQAITVMMIMVFFVAGCAGIRIAKEDYPVYVYPQPFDLVYLKAYETVDAFPDWIPLTTDRGTGLITFRNSKYGNLFDYDAQHVAFVVKPLGRNQTSLEVDLSQSQCKEGACVKLLKSVHDVLKDLPVREAPESKSEEAEEAETV